MAAKSSLEAGSKPFRPVALGQTFPGTTV